MNYLFEIKELVKDNGHEKYKYDFQTPVPVAKYMASLLPANIMTVLEPTPGKGNIEKILRAKGYDVTAPEDFFIER